MLLIEKLVKLLSDDHYAYFHDHVKNASLRSYYPLVLLDLIDRDPAVTHPTAWFCRRVYGLDAAPNDAELHKFRQLASYTFKMVEPLSNNFPNFLAWNITRVYECINQGDPKGAVRVCELTRDVAEKIEDWNTEQRALEILAERETKRQEDTNALRYQDRIDVLLDNQSIMNRMMRHIRTHFHGKAKPKAGTDLEPILADFRKYLDHDSKRIVLLARFFRANTYYFYRHPKFKSDEFFAELELLESEIDTHRHLVPEPFLPLAHRVQFLKLNHLAQRGELDSERVLDLADRITQESDRHLFWNSFVNVPEIFGLAVQLSHYSTHAFRSYAKNLKEELSGKDYGHIQNLTERSQQLLNLEDISQQNTTQHINLTTIYAGYLILGEPDAVRRGILELEGLLISFQQVPFHAFLDSIYAFLHMGSFALGDFDALDTYFKRYKKATNGKAVNPENDLAIHALYYVGKWINTGRKQYGKKLGGVLEESLNAGQKNVKAQLRHILEYFDLHPAWEPRVTV